MATSNQYDVKVAEQAHADAVRVLQARETQLKSLQDNLAAKALRQVLTVAEVETLKTLNKAALDKIPADRLDAAKSAYTQLLSSSTAYQQIQKSLDTSQTAVKSTQLDLNNATNGVRVTQGKTGEAISPALDPSIKQRPYIVTTPTNGEILNNPTGLILGATALAAITSNPNLISSIGSGIGRFFNNAGDILPVSTNVPSATAPVNPESVPAPAAAPPVGETTAAAAPVAGDEALAAAQAAQEVRDLQIAAGSSTPVDIQTDGLLEQQQAILQAQEEAQFNARLDRAAELDLANSGDAALEAANRAREAADLQTAALTYSPAPVSTLTAVNPEEFGATNVVQNQADVDANNSVARGATNRAQQQSTLQTRVNQPAAADWRVRLRLAPNADYLYKVPAGTNGKDGPGILAPLAVTDGVVFPYTPSIETSYQAKYDSYDLTHSNYRGYFYKSSMIENISIKGTFTAQDTYEAAYLLAVIHFFKSVTKMFYGQDAQAGTPPPLVYLSGFGKYQFNENPCVVTNFGYSLPNDVDYIRADGFNNIGLNLENRRPRTSGPAIGGSLGTVVAIIDRLTNAGFKNGSLTDRPSPGQVTQNVTNQTSINSTYVPTKMEISITLLPMQTRNQVSKQFSLKSFANGSLLAGGGFW